MNHAEFWRLIDESRQHRDQAAALTRALLWYPREEIESFDAWFWAYHGATRRADLWAAFHAIQGGCTDDGFDFARAWLIGRGEATLLAAIRDPESLAAYASRAMRDELLIAAADQAYKRATGEAMPAHGRSVTIPERWPADRLAGITEWTADVYRAHFPTLHARFIATRSGTIDHARFWALIDEARANNPAAICAELRRMLVTGSAAEAIGFARWLRTYNVALMRNDLRATCRVALGDSDLSIFTGFRGALIARGHAATLAAIAEPDDIALPIVPLPDVISVGIKACSDKGIAPPDHDDLADIPDHAAWPPDGAPVYAPAHLRARFPRLAAGKPDRALTGPVDPSVLDDLERERHAKQRYQCAATLSDVPAAITLLDEALTFLPPQTPAQLMPDVLLGLAVQVLARRGRLHARLGHRAEALCDFDTALAIYPSSRPIQVARDALLGIRPSPAAPPRRVRHPKLGEGAVILATGTGSDRKYVIDFTVGRKTMMARYVEPLD
jgi:tetratricopeptide (TPR) repeat protein